MYVFAVLALALFVVFIIIARQLGSIQSSSRSQEKIRPDADSDRSLMSTDTPQHGLQTLFGSVHEAAYHNPSVDNYAPGSMVNSDVSVGYSSSDYSTGGELGTAFAEAIDGSSSFGASDSGSDFGGGTTSDGSSS